MKQSLFLLLLSLLFFLACEQEKTPTELRTEALPFTNQAQSAYTSADYANALVNIDSSLAIFPDNQDLLLLRAKSHIILKNKEEGFNALNVVIDKYPKLYAALAERAIYYVNEKEYDKARVDIDKAVAGLPYNKDLLSQLGLIQQYQEKHGEAIATFDKIIEKDSSSSNPFFYRGMNKKWNNDLEGARKDLIKALTLKPSNYDAHDNLGAIELVLGNYASALENFTFNIGYGLNMELPQLKSASLNNRADTYIKIEDYEKALKDLEESEKAFPENSYTYRTRALVYIAQNKSKAACEQLNKAEELGFGEKHGKEVAELLAANCQ